jgi:hypothetical protein
MGPCTPMANTPEYTQKMREVVALEHKREYPYTIEELEKEFPAYSKQSLKAKNRACREALFREGHPINLEMYNPAPSKSKEKGKKEGKGKKGKGLNNPNPPVTYSPFANRPVIAEWGEECNIKIIDEEMLEVWSEEEEEPTSKRRRIISKSKEGGVKRRAKRAPYRKRKPPPQTPPPKKRVCREKDRQGLEEEKEEESESHHNFHIPYGYPWVNGSLMMLCVYLNY